MSRESHGRLWGEHPQFPGAGPSISVGDYFLLVDRRARVRAAFLAAADRDAADRVRAAERAWRASAFPEAVRCGSRFNALRTARARLDDGFRLRPA
jgi:hypothetical protein